MGSGGAGGGGGPQGGGWRGICATSTLARLDARNCWMAVCKACGSGEGVDRRGMS